MSVKTVAWIKERIHATCILSDDTSHQVDAALTQVAADLESLESRLQQAEQALRESEQRNEALSRRVIQLQEELAAPKALSVSASWVTACNCQQHKHGESTGGWYCPAHGQQL